MDERPVVDAKHDTPAETKQPPTPPLLEVLGPGLITGASDDDPSGIATYSQAGAQFGYDLGWTLLFSWPLMCAIQEISARIGRVTGRGIAGNLKQHYPAPVVYRLIAPAGGGQRHQPRRRPGRHGRGAQAADRRTGAPLRRRLRRASPSLLEVFVRYSRYVSVLKWLTLSLFAYVAVALVVHMPWPTVAVPPGRSPDLA